MTHMTHTSTEPPEALRLAEHLEKFRSFPDDLAAAAELRRLHSIVQELEAALVKEAARTANENPSRESCDA